MDGRLIEPTVSGFRFILGVLRIWFHHHWVATFVQDCSEFEMRRNWTASARETHGTEWEQCYICYDWFVRLARFNLEKNIDQITLLLPSYLPVLYPTPEVYSPYLECNTCAWRSSSLSFVLCFLEGTRIFNLSMKCQTSIGVVVVKLYC